MTVKELTILYCIYVCKNCNWDRVKSANTLGISIRTLRQYLNDARERGLIKGTPWSRVLTSSVNLDGVEEIVSREEKERQRFLDLMDGHYKRKYKVRGA